MAVTLITRRELSLLLFALSAFLIAYNLSSTPALSLSLASSPVSSVDAAALSAQALLRSHKPTLRKDGRRASVFVDELEDDILGTWEIEARKEHDLSPYGVTEDTQHFWWEGGDIPRSKLVAHVPGYTVIDNVYMRDGTLFIVTDNTAVFPAPEAIISSAAGSSSVLVAKEMRFVNRRQAVEIIGYSAHRMSGSSILSLDAPSLVDNQTFLALHRAYAALAPSPLRSSHGSPVPNAPSQIFFTALPAHDLASTGYPINLARAAFPMTTHVFADDWADLARSGRPIVFERALLTDRQAAEAHEAAFDFGSRTAVVAPGNRLRGGKGEEGGGTGEVVDVESEEEKRMVRTVIEATDKRLSFAPAFALPAPQTWAEPIIAGAELIARSLKLPSLPFSQQKQKQTSSWGWGAADEKKKAITYVSTQSRAGARLREGDHQMLVRELRRLGESSGWEVYIVELGEAKEHEVVGAVAASSILLGTHGQALAYTYLLTTPPSSSSSDAVKPGQEKAMALEFFPDGRFSNENAFVARAMGVGYTCWRNTKKYTSPTDLPPISPPTPADSHTLAVDVTAVITFVREVMRR